MTDDAELTPLSQEELAAEGGTALPDKEVVSILDLNVDLDLAIDAAAPIDLAVAANANIAAPIEAAVSANILSDGSTAQAMTVQTGSITQGIEGTATADATQDSLIDQGNDVVDGGTTATPATGALPDGGTVGDATGTVGDATGTVGGTLPDTGGTLPDTGGTLPDTGGTLPDAGGTLPDVGGTLDGNLLNVNVDLAADADITAPIDGAVAANANAAAPISAAVSANIGSESSEAVAVSNQTVDISQNITGSAEANAEQTSDITQ